MDDLGERERSWNTSRHIKTPEGELFLVNSFLGSRSKPVFCFLPPCLACLGLDWSFWGYRSDPLQLESNQTISFLSSPLKLCVLTIVVSSVALFQFKNVFKLNSNKKKVSSESCLVDATTCTASSEGRFEEVPFIEHIVCSVTSFAKREFLFSKSCAGASYSATVPAKMQPVWMHFQL
jgi:hypothetical protein